MHVRIAKFELIRSNGRVFISTRIIELPACSVRDVQNGQDQEEQPFIHGGNFRSGEYHQNTTCTTRIINSSNEKMVSKRGDKGTAVAKARRETSFRSNGTTRISRTT